MDHAAIADFNQRLAWETEQLRLDSATVSAGVQAVLTQPRHGIYFVAVAEGRVIGQCSVTYEWSDWRNGELWWLQSVYVDAAWRGQGVFRALFEAVERTAGEAGAVGLRLYVEENNEGAQATYRRHGMEKTHYLVYEKTLGTDRPA
ncbi:MAG: GNAT family N-acetyltransferase [Verrucomicrobiales bacterium]|nr:GNAT family N-acetyltransferase [Verrucomicrobiales bacterium]